MITRRHKPRKLPRLKQRMDQRRVDAPKLCERAGITATDLNALVACEREANPEEFEALANALACYPEDLFDSKVPVGQYTQSIRGHIDFGDPLDRG